MPDAHVLSDHPPLHHNSYRASVAAVLNALKAEFGESDQDVADRLGCSATTVNNACNKRGNLDPVTLLKIGKEYGVQRLDTVMGLIGGKLAGQDAFCTSDERLPVGAARGQLFLAEALADKRIDDHEILAGAADIELAYETFGNLKWRLDGLRRERAA